MKLMIASDIHGSAYYCKKITAAFEREKADKLLLLGDILYHGPRNALPKDYSPKEVAAMLNAMKNKIICVKGNCDCDVDQMVLDFPIMAPYCIIAFENRIIFATHGDKFNVDNLPALNNGDVLLYGHFHVPACEEKDSYIYESGFCIDSQGKQQKQLHGDGRRLFCMERYGFKCLHGKTFVI